MSVAFAYFNGHLYFQLNTLPPPPSQQLLNCHRLYANNPLLQCVSRVLRETSCIECRFPLNHHHLHSVSRPIPVHPAGALQELLNSTFKRIIRILYDCVALLFVAALNAEVVTTEALVS